MPGKRLDLVPVDYNGNLEKGLKFVLVKGRKTDRKDDEEEDEDMSVKSVESRDGDGDGSEGEKEAGDPKGRGDGHGKDSMLAAVRRCFKSTEELSGGQRALLGLSFVFAAALHKTSPLYLLDEV